MLNILLKLFVFCVQINHICLFVTIVLHISPTVPVNIKFCYQTIPNATSVSMLSKLHIDFP